MPMASAFAGSQKVTPRFEKTDLCMTMQSAVPIMIKTRDSI